MTLSHPVVPRLQYYKRLQSDLKNLPKVKILKFHFFKLEYFKTEIFLMH